MNTHYLEFTSANGKRHLVNRANIFAINEEEALTGTGDTKVYVVTTNGQATLARESYEELVEKLTGSRGESVEKHDKHLCCVCKESPRIYTPIGENVIICYNCINLIKYL